MDKILVPTDFSSNSKPGIRFAIRMAARSKASLVFIHIISLDGDEDKAKLKLERFVQSVYQSMKLEEMDVFYEVVKGFKVDLALLSYCEENPDVNYLCIATRGASFINKILGTNTSNLIEKSLIPVIAVPKTYRAKPLESILYATDLTNLEDELEVLVNYARPKGLSIKVLHFSSPSTQELQSKLTNELEIKFNYPLTIKKVDYDINDTLYKNIQKQVHKIKPSMLCLFTNNDRTFYEKVFLPSLTEKISYHTSVPLLAYKKLK